MLFFLHTSARSSAPASGGFPPDLGRALRRKHAMHATRVRLRRLLSALIAEREDSQLLYIPHGEPGMRRMIARAAGAAPAR